MDEELDSATAAWLELQRTDAAITARAEPMMDVRPPRRQAQPRIDAVQGNSRVDAIWEELKESDRRSMQRSRSSSGTKRDRDATTFMDTDEAVEVPCRDGLKRRCEKLEMGLIEETSPPLSATPETLSPFKRLRL